MFNRAAKLLLVATSLAPVLGAVAVNQFARDEPWTSWVPWLSAGLGCVVVCWLMLVLAGRRGERQPMQVAEVESADKEMLGFLLTYLLPFIASDKAALTGLRRDVAMTAAGTASLRRAHQHALEGERQRHGGGQHDRALQVDARPEDLLR